MHCHILPNVDDGADSMSVAAEIINSAYKTGTRIMIVTPHYNYPEKVKYHNNKSELTEEYRKLAELMSQQIAGMKFFLGSELLANDNIGDLYKNNELITINGSRYILTEFYFNENIKNVNRYTNQLISMGLTPIIAHPERYGFLQNLRDVENLLNKGCKIQINKDSVLGRYGIKPKESAIRMLNNDYVHFIASDCHNTSSRNADLSELYIKLLENFSQKKINDLFHDNQKRVLLDVEF